MGIILARWIIAALGFLAAAYIVPGITVGGIYIAFILAVFWGILNITVKPLLFLLTLPVNVVTFGLFTFVINGFLLWFLASFIEQFEVTGIFAGFLGALVIAAMTWVGERFIESIA